MKKNSTLSKSGKGFNQNIQCCQKSLFLKEQTLSIIVAKSSLKCSKKGKGCEWGKAFWSCLNTMAIFVRSRF